MLLLFLQLEGYQINQLQMNASAEDMGYGRHPGQSQGDAIFQPMECEPTLQMGYLLIIKILILHTCQLYVFFKLVYLNKRVMNGV